MDGLVCTIPRNRTLSFKCIGRIFDPPATKYFMCIDETSSHYGHILSMLSKRESELYSVGDIVAGGLVKVVAGQDAAKLFFI